MPGQLAFRILGPVEIDRDGSPLALRGGKVRGLLGVLLLRMGQTVPADTLIQALWGDEPPATARTALQMHVSRLRKFLAPDPSVALETRGSGYVLHVAPDRIDRERFRGLVSRARSELDRGDTEGAYRALEEAVELWRGEPLSGVDLAGISTLDLGELDELALSTRVDRCDVALTLGRHVEVLSELERLRDANPLNERIHAMSALALYRSGRQADALEVLTVLRHGLSAELGIEAGPAVRRLEQQILDQDPALDLTPAAATQAPRIGRKSVAALVCRFTIEDASGDLEAGRVMLEPLSRMAEEVLREHGAFLHEALVGKLVAVFGVPSTHEDDAARAARAAIELRERIQQPAAGASAVGVEMRTGISMRQVLVQTSREGGSLLSVEPLEEADALARAARPGEILLGSAAASMIRHVAGLEPSQILLLGSETPVAAFRLLEISPQSLQGRRFDAPMVGRREELALLRQTFLRTAGERRSSLVTLLGPAGVGKTRLMSEFLRTVDREATILSGRCLSYGGDITYWPVAQMIRQATGIAPTDPTPRARDKIAAMLDGIEDAGFIEEQVASVLGLTSVPPVAAELFWAIRRFFETAGMERPLVLVFDDIHWAESTLLDLIEHVASSSRDAPLLLACMARPELTQARPSWGGGRVEGTNLSLHPLSRGESLELIANLLGSVELAEEVRDHILEVGEGHPLFLEELVRMLRDEELIRWEDGRWVTSADPASLPVPPTVQALIGARLDRLPTDQRSVLERASVIGTEFMERDLASLLPDDHALGELLDSLAADGSISVQRESHTAGRTFRFRHLMVRDVVYAAMSLEARAATHATLAGHLEEGSERVVEFEEIVGYHLEAAYTYRLELGSPDPDLAWRAGRHLASAAERALARDDMPAAVSLLRRGLALLGGEDPLRCDVGWRLGAALFETGDLETARGVVESALRDAERLGQEAAAWRSRLELADLGFWLEPEAKNTFQAERCASEAIAAMGRLGDGSGLARAHRLLGDALARRGEVAESVHAYETSRRLALEAGDRLEASRRSNLGVLHGPLPVPRCIEIMEANLEQAHRPQPETQAGLGFLLAMDRRSEDARRLLADAASRADQLGIEWRLASINMHYGAALLFLDDPVSAEHVLRPAVETLRRMGERSMLSTAVAVLGEALFRQDRLDEAMQASVESELATAEDDVASQMAWRGLRAKILSAKGSLEEGERLGREAVAYADRTDLLSMAGDAHLDLAAVLRASGKHAEAARQLDLAASLYERKGSATGLARVRTARAESMVPSPRLPR